GLPSYAASKAGLIHLTHNMALELGSKGITVNAIAPGYIVTEMNSEFLNGPGGEALAKRIPMRRIGQPEDLAGALLLLASDAGRGHPGRWRASGRGAVTEAAEEERFLAEVRETVFTRAILERLPALDLPQCFLVAGCLFQTVWNLRSGRPPEADINDYDVFY